MKKILKDISFKPVGDEGSSLAIALFFFLLCSILCAGMLGMGLSQVNSAHTLVDSSDNLDVNALNPIVRTMVGRYMDIIKSSGIRYYPELNQVNMHMDSPIGLAVEDLCNTVHETGSTASRLLTVVFDTSDDLNMPELADGRMGFELIIMMDTDYTISFCVYGAGANSSQLVRIAHINSSYNEDDVYYEWCE